MKKAFIKLLLFLVVTAVLIFPNEVRWVLVSLVTLFGIAIWPAIVLGLVMMAFEDIIPVRSYVPKMSWWQAFKETIAACFNGTITDEFLLIND